MDAALRCLSGEAIAGQAVLAGTARKRDEKSWVVLQIYHRLGWSALEALGVVRCRWSVRCDAGIAVRSRLLAIHESMSAMISNLDS